MNLVDAATRSGSYTYGYNPLAQRAPAPSAWRAASRRSRGAATRRNTRNSLTHGPHADRNPIHASVDLTDPLRSATPPASLKLYYHGRRYYSPELSRWASRDPIGEAGGSNLFSLVRNVPSGRVDTLGMVCGGGYWPDRTKQWYPPPKPRKDYKVDHEITDIDWSCLGGKTIAGLLGTTPGPELPDPSSPGLFGSCGTCLGLCAVFCETPGTCVACMGMNPACTTCSLGLLELGVEGAERIKVSPRCWRGYRPGLVSKKLDYPFVDGRNRLMCRYGDYAFPAPLYGDCPKSATVPGMVKNYIDCPPEELY